jgi:Ca2+-transporting ATPase
LLASNTGELFVLLSAQLVAGMTLPLTTLQILWMNLITDGIPALALGVENPERGAMQRAPYAPNESLFGRGLGRHIVIVGLIMGIAGLLLGNWAFNQYNAEAAQIMGITIEQLVAAENIPVVTSSNAPALAAEIGITPQQLKDIHNGVGTENYHDNTWNTMVFMFLTLAQMGHALGLRSHRESLFSLKFFSNRLLIGAVVVTVVLQLGAVYLPFFNNLFNTAPLSLEQLAICFVVSTVVFIAVEIEKLLIRRNVLR